jgi:hypothetical protein
MTTRLSKPSNTKVSGANGRAEVHPPGRENVLVGPEWDRMRSRIAELRRDNPEALIGLGGSVLEFESDDPVLARAMQGDFAREAIREKYGEEVLKRLEALCGG